MKTIDVLFAEDMKRDYGCSPYFLRQHGRAMGGYGKPMRWHRDVVERYLVALATAAERKRIDAKEMVRAAKDFIDSRVCSIKSAASASGQVGQIKVRGGKGRRESAA
jgi:hypothetical protein